MDEKKKKSFVKIADVVPVICSLKQISEQYLIVSDSFLNVCSTARLVANRMRAKWRKKRMRRYIFTIHSYFFFSTGDNNQIVICWFL
jgi:hypothetical protein